MANTQGTTSSSPPPPTAPLCGLCTERASHRRSHIVPKFELKRLKQGDAKFLLFDPEAPRQPTAFADACYEEQLLCDTHENKCGELDNDAVRIFDNVGPWLSRVRRPTPWVIPNVDAARLTTFLVSVALRAHASKRSVFKQFDLGSDFEPSRRAFETGDPFGHGFRLLAQVPRMDGYPQGFRALPFVSPGRTGVVMWFGVFRFVLGLPSRGWTAAVNARSTNQATGGLMVSVVELERLDEFKEYRRRRAAAAERLSPQRGEGV